MTEDKLEIQTIQKLNTTQKKQTTENKAKQKWTGRLSPKWLIMCRVVEVHRIWIRPDTNSLDLVNWIYYHVVVPITVSMHLCFITQCQESVKSLN